MPAFYTVRWPLFARLEAALLFPAAVLLAAGLAPSPIVAGWGPLPPIAPFLEPLGLTEPRMFWAGVSIAVAVPFLAGTVLADRLLTVRKGFAILSLLAIGAWAFVGMALADRLPFARKIGTAGFDAGEIWAAAFGAAAFLVHLWPLVSGAIDRGDIAARLLAAKEEHQFARDRRGRPHIPGDIYRQHTAAFRTWRDRATTGALSGTPRESLAVRVLWALTWIGAIGGAGAAFLARGELPEVIRSGGAPASPVVVASGTPAPHGSIPLGSIASGPLPIGAAMAPPPGSPPGLLIAAPRFAPAQTAPRPAVQTAGAAPSVSTSVAMPTVQRPGEFSASTSSASLQAGQNEAVAERGRDGHFQFDAVINGAHVPMLFDTGASVVALRAEDASRLGIGMDKLRWTAKAKTANGTADVAPVMIDAITVGNITIRGVPGFVGRPGALHANLLGQAFLARLAGYNVERNQLVLRGR